MGEHKEKAIVWLFLYVKEPKQGVLRVNYSRSKTTMRREWAMKNPPHNQSQLAILIELSIDFFSLKPLK